MKILFAGTPAIAVPSLRALSGVNLEDGFCELVGVLTNPDSAKGRRGEFTPSDIGAAAEEILRDAAARGKTPFVLLKYGYVDEACFQSAAVLGADLLVSFAYGAIFSAKFLALFPMGGLNIHPSLLPKYRGASPIQTAILNRENETGISIQRLAEKLDSGDVLAQEIIALNGRETCASLSAVVAEKSAGLLVRTLRTLALGECAGGSPQDHGAASFCGKFEREDGRIDWRQDVPAIDARIRAFTPWPLAYTRHDGMELYILEAAPYKGDASGFAGSNACPAGTVLGVDKSTGIIVQTGGGLLSVSCLQYRARKRLDWRSFLNGAQNFIGSVLG